MSIGTLHVKVISARNLRIADIGGLSDPFVVLHLASPSTAFDKLDSAPKFGTTKVIQKDLNPNWNEEFQVDLHDIHECVVIHVWDKDLIGKDDLGWLALSVRHNAELLLSNKPAWLPLSLGSGEGAEIQLQFWLSGSPKPFGTIIREGVRENNVPVNSAASGVALRQSLIRKEARVRAREYNAKRKVWKRTTDGFDIPIPPGAWIKQNQFTGRWRFLFRRERETYSSEYINIAAYVREAEKPGTSVADFAVEATRCQVEDANFTVMGHPAVKLTGMSSTVYFVDIGSHPLYWVIYISDDFSKRPPASHGHTAQSSVAMMFDAGNQDAKLNFPKLSDLPTTHFELRTYECKLECPALWYVNYEPHYAVLHSPWSKTVIDDVKSQQMDITDRIRISRKSHKTAEEAAKSFIVNAKAARKPPTVIVENPTEAAVKGAKVKFLYVKWKVEGDLTYTAYCGEVQPGVVVAMVYETFTSRSEADLPAILASVEYLPGM